MHRKNTTRKAFTLSEATLVLAILGVIAALGIGVLRYMNVSQFPTLKAVFKNDLATSLATMNIDESIASIQGTKDLIEKAQEYYDFSNQANFDDIFADKKTGYKDAAGNTVDMSHFADVDDGDFYVFKTSSGASVAVKYVKEAKDNIDIDSFAQTASQINGADATYEISNKTLNFVTGFYDVNGPEGPNKIGEDVAFIMPNFVLNKDLGEYLTVENGEIVRKNANGETTRLVDRDGVFDNTVASTVTEDPDCPPGTVSDGTDVCACPYNDTYCQERGKKFDRENCACRNATDEGECTETNQTFDSGTGRCVCGPNPQPGDLCGRYSINSAIGDYNNCTCKCNQMSKLACLNPLADRKCTWNDNKCEVTCGADAVSHCAAKTAETSEYANTATPDANDFCACKCNGLKKSGEIELCNDDAQPELVKTETSEPFTEGSKICTTTTKTYRYTQTCKKIMVTEGTIAQGCANIEPIGGTYKKQKPGTDLFTQDEKKCDDGQCGADKVKECRDQGREIKPFPDCTCGAKTACSVAELAAQPCGKDYTWKAFPDCKCEFTGKPDEPGKCPSNGESDCKTKYGENYVYTDDCQCINCTGYITNVPDLDSPFGSGYGKCGLKKPSGTKGKSNYKPNDEGKTCATFAPVDNHKNCRAVYNPAFKFSPCDPLNPEYTTWKNDKGKVFYVKKSLSESSKKKTNNHWYINDNGKCVRVFKSSTCIKHCSSSSKMKTLHKKETCKITTTGGTYLPEGKITGNNPKSGTVKVTESCKTEEWTTTDPILLIIPSTGNPADSTGVPTMATENGQLKFLPAITTQYQKDHNIKAKSSWLAGQVTPKYFFLVKPNVTSGTPVWEKVMFTDMDVATGLIELKNTYDTNNDGVINELDGSGSVISTLKLWADKNGNASIDSGELYVLKDDEKFDRYVEIIEISTKYSIRSAATGEVEQSTAAVTALTGSFEAAIRPVSAVPYTKKVERTTYNGKVLYINENYFYEFTGSSYIPRYRKEANGAMTQLTAYSGDHPLRNVSPANIARFVKRGSAEYRIDTYKIIDIMFATLPDEQAEED